ncbi:hypothetical protein [Moraxella ovis]|uniref:hypothetical protein n=1 Tax=Moraxella ovis TaxID=29433 RepID=UPI000D9BEBD3|nr:hypothetical protein [Moraxella ovis]SPX83110.1 Uncharacterised protein [Moraxella ovis]STZ06493.1 Uncharacterised protein [Moraxella ovis]
MELTDILAELRHLSLKINPNPTPFFIKITLDDIRNIGTRTGVEVDIRDVSIDPHAGTWVYKGRHVLLFIPDQGSRFDDVMDGSIEGTKFHLTDCQTINNMKQNGRFDRYRVTNSIEGIFEIYGTDRYNNKPKTGEARLYVCKQCLAKLQYKQYHKAHHIEKIAIYNHFDLDEFFQSLPPVYLPPVQEPRPIGQGRTMLYKGLG